jgi:hypothetical protein
VEKHTVEAVIQPEVGLQAALTPKVMFLTRSTVWNVRAPSSVLSTTPSHPD